MNNLGGMVFIVAGIAMGYWVATGHAANFLHAVNFGTTSGQQPSGPSRGLFGLPTFTPWWISDPGVNAAATEAAFPNDLQNTYQGSNVAPNNAVTWNTMAV